MPADLSDLLPYAAATGFLTDLVQVDQSQLDVRIRIAYLNEIRFCYFDQFGSSCGFDIGFRSAFVLKGIYVSEELVFEQGGGPFTVKRLVFVS